MLLSTRPRPVRGYLAALLCAISFHALAEASEPPPLVNGVIGGTRIHVSEPVDYVTTVTLTRPGSPPLKLKNVSFDLMYSNVAAGASPNLIVRGFSQGAHCCFTLYAISYTPTLHEQEIQVRDADLITMHPGEHGAGPQLDFFDFNFAYWRAPFAASPAPPISLIWDATQTRYVLNVAGMRKPAPSERELKEDAQALLKEEVDARRPWPPTLLWDDMLGYIYAGNSAAARMLMDTAWRPSWGNKKLFATCFSQRLHAGWLWKHMDIGKLMKADGDFPEPARVPAACGAAEAI